MTSDATPPRLARRLLARALPADVRDHIEGDLLEVDGRRRARDGASRARRWYWSQAVVFAGRFLIERLRSDSGHQQVAASTPRRRGPLLPSALELRLGGRMLVKHPALTV